MNNNTSSEEYKEIPQSRFPEFTKERAKELADEICGRMGCDPDSCELFIELIRGIMGECKTPDHDGDHSGGFWAVHAAFIYTHSYDKSFNAWLKGKGGDDESEPIN